MRVLVILQLAALLLYPALFTRSLVDGGLPMIPIAPDFILLFLGVVFAVTLWQLTPDAFMCQGFFYLAHTVMHPNPVARVWCAGVLLALLVLHYAVFPEFKNER